jgi:DNA-binding MarR family transcriptional regulator
MDSLTELPMDKRGRVNLAAFNAFADQLRAHPRFAEARSRFCADVPGRWMETPLKRWLIADTGGLAVALCITGMHRLFPEQGAQLQMIIRALTAANVASAARVRALVDQLVHRGGISIEPSPVDRRAHRLVPTDLLVESHLSWFDSVLPAVAMLFPLPPIPDDTTARQELSCRYVTSIIMRQSMDGFTIYDGFPEMAAFMERRQGYLLMLDLAAPGTLHVPLSRSDAARRYAVSPQHVSALLTNAEEQGWLTRDRSGTIHLSPDFATRLEVWVARELAIVGLWLVMKLR